MHWHTYSVYEDTHYLNAGFRTVGRVVYDPDIKQWHATVFLYSLATPDVTMPHESLDDAKDWVENMARLRYDIK